LLTIEASIADASMGEFSLGGNPIITLSEAPASQVTVDWATADITATAGSDYNAASGTVTFEIGQTTQSIGLTILNDSTPEINETFAVNLSNPSGLSIADGQAIVTILDDEPPTLSVSDVTVAESNSGTVNAVFSVSILRAPTQQVTVAYATANGTATTSGSDYTAASGTLTWAASDGAAKSVTVSVSGDTLEESGETFKLVLSSPSNASLADATGLCVIVDNDAAGMTNDPIEGIGDVHAGYFTTSYTLPSGVTLEYSTSGDARPIVIVDTVLPEDSDLPDIIEARLTLGGLQGSSTFYDTDGFSPGDPVRFVHMVNASSLSSGTYNWTLDIVEHHGEERSYRTFTGKVCPQPAYLDWLWGPVVDCRAGSACHRCQWRRPRVLRRPLHALRQERQQLHHTRLVHRYAGQERR
jgi:hypothetical protein